MNKHCDMCRYRKKMQGTTVYICTALSEVLQGIPPIRRDNCPLEKETGQKEPIKLKRDK